MFEVEFYYDKNDVSDIMNLIDELKEKVESDKNARINYKKILTYIKVLSIEGTRAGEPYVKKLEGNLWELRPLKNRIIFFYWKDNKFVLLHHFMKKTQKTPKRELDVAKSKLKDYKGRNDTHEKEN